MKKFFVALLMLLTIPAFATGVSSTASTADCDNATLNTYTGTSNLSAGWQPNTIDLHWYADSDTTTEMNVANASQSCTYDGTLTPPATIPTKTGYTFKGWMVRGVPDGYTRLQYIQSTGTQYINTNITGGTRVVIDVIGTPRTDDYVVYLFGKINATGYTDGLTQYKGQWANGSSVDTRQRFDVEYSASGLNINGVLYTNRTLANNVNLGLFGSTASNRRISGAKVYSVQIYNNTTLIRDFIPAKNDSNVVGMWDTVSKTFFTNSGTGTFVAGPTIQ